MTDYIYSNLHIMWYEEEMLPETFKSIKQAIENSILPVKVDICINLQTNIEEPIISKNYEDIIRKMISEYITPNEIVIKTNNDEFYNIGDWRRERYDINAKYTVWLESDCLLPFNYFSILSHFNISEKHALTISSRKMWDESWKIVEHDLVKGLSTDIDTIPLPFWCGHYINQDDVNKFSNVKKIIIDIIDRVKFDGALVALSGGIDFIFIPFDMHFCHEDTCTEISIQKHGLRQYHIRNVMKGHNYSHPLKRTNTDNTRNDELYKKYKEQSYQAMVNFIK